MEATGKLEVHHNFILHVVYMYLKSLVCVFVSISMIKNVEKCCLEEIQGRPWKLFFAPADTAIAHCVSSDFQMDNGIAKQFLKKYGNLE